MKFGRYVTVDDGGNYVTVYELNVRRIIRRNESLAACPTHIVLRMKQVNFKARWHDLQNRLVFFSFVGELTKTSTRRNGGRDI